MTTITCHCTDCGITHAVDVPEFAARMFNPARRCPSCREAWNAGHDERVAEIRRLLPDVRWNAEGGVFDLVDPRSVARRDRAASVRQGLPDVREFEDGARLTVDGFDFVARVPSSTASALDNFNAPWAPPHWALQWDIGLEWLEIDPDASNWREQLAQVVAALQ